MEPSIQRLSSRIVAQGRDDRVARERRPKQRGSQAFDWNDDIPRPHEAAPEPTRLARTTASSARAHEDGVGGEIDLIA